VSGRKSVGHTEQQPDHVMPGARFAPNPFLERAAVDEFSDQVLAAVELAGVVHGEDVRVIERRSRLRFALEPATSGRIRQQQLGEKLDGDRAIQLRVEAAVDLTHPAAAERRDDFVRPDARADDQGHQRFCKTKSL
jgi:hypothetical protein